MTLLGVRIAGVVIGLLALVIAIVERQRVRASLRTFFLEPSSAFNLGALRIVLFSMLVQEALIADAAWFARLPASLRELPPGWRWLNSDAFFDPTFAGLAQNVLVGVSACAALGLFTRVSAPIAALLSMYVLGMQNFFVKINHSNHATVLCALVLACSPCGDALSIDRLWKRFRGYAAPQLAVLYTVPVRCCWLVLGTVYLFPGLYKLFESGHLWLSGDKVKAEMYARWGEKGFEPIVRIDQSPALLALLGLATLLFEIGFFFALFNRVSRVIAAFSAVGFHLGVSAFMGINFHIFLPLVLLFDEPQLGERVRSWLPASVGRSVDAGAAAVAAWMAQHRPRFASTANARPFPKRNPWPGASAGVLLVSAQLLAGVVPIVSWPISIHPRFSNPRKASTNVRSTRVMLEPRTGKATDLGPHLAHLGGARFARLLADLKQAHGRAKLHEQGQTIVTLFRQSGVEVKPGDHVAVYRVRSKLFPLGEHRDYHETLAQRYEITDDFAVKLVK